MFTPKEYDIELETGALALAGSVEPDDSVEIVNGRARLTGTVLNAPDKYLVRDE
jgi:hypothetical protein